MKVEQKPTRTLIIFFFLNIVSALSRRGRDGTESSDEHTMFYYYECLS